MSTDKRQRNFLSPEEAVEYLYQIWNKETDENEANSISVAIILPPPDAPAIVRIFMTIGYHTLPRELMYWDRSPDCSVEIVADCMSRNRFQDIKKNHFNDNSSIDKEDRYYKVRRLYDLANESRKKYGILPYQDKKDNDHEALSFRVAKSLASIIESRKQLEIYIDNFFTSYKLAVMVKEKGFFVTGTVWENRIEKCPLKPFSEMKKKERGAIDKCLDTNNNIGIVRWNDNKVVTVVTSFESLDPKGEVQRRTKGSITNIAIPHCISSHNKYKNRVDLFDNLMAEYQIWIHGKKWYFPLFTNVLNTMVVASWKLYTTADLGTHDLLMFRRQLATFFLKSSVTPKPRPEQHRKENVLWTSGSTTLVIS
ncbi:hypothetical protein ANN_27768 [Periplaneta americana]|uniref:PiggyBac transposable element-derived protein domain-containing protein n=1 Tax=Periplaneta americana TaxID=6978 RepID=A0ABQ8RV61_PERAM|nr:hypothetical protein ANN_27768 [Periplaneta americana]